VLGVQENDIIKGIKGLGEILVGSGDEDERKLK